MLTSRSLLCVFAASWIGCTFEHGSLPMDPTMTDPEEPANPDDPSDPDDPAEPCTAATDAVPLDDLVNSLAKQPIGDVVRAIDGTVYFVSGFTANYQSATIGRRVPCGAIEKDWLTMPAAIVDLALSADNHLYLAATGAGGVGDINARLFRLDLDAPTPVVESIVNQPGQSLRSVAASPDGRVYFVAGWSTERLYYVEGDLVTPHMPLASDDGTSLLSHVDSIAVAANGTVLLTGELNGSARLGRIQFNESTGGATLTVMSAPYRIANLRADIHGGYYGVRDTGVSSNKTLTLVHANSLISDRTTVDQIAGVGQAAFVFDATGDANEVLRLTTMPQATVTSVALPIPTVEP